MKNVTFSCVLGRSLLWPKMSESFSKNGIQPKPDPIEGIDNLALVVAGIFGGYIGCGAHGQGVMEGHNPNLAHLSDFNSFLVVIHMYFV